jgi:tripartite-type tricarboxylate transporter receptor subunit TctC
MKFLISLLFFVSTLVSAEPIELVVPNAPGGPNDNVTRHFTESLTEKGVKNFTTYRPGASGNIGMKYFMECKVNCLLVSAPAIVQNKVQAPEGYPAEIVKEAKPLYLFGVSPVVVLVPADSKTKSITDLIELSKTRSLLVAHGGAGTMGYNGMKELCRIATCTEVPYKSASVAYPDLMAGRVDVHMVLSSGLESVVKNDKIRIIAVLGQSRLPMIPSVPTAVEQGYNMRAVGWVIIFYRNLVPDLLPVAKAAAKTVPAELAGLMPINVDLDSFWKDEVSKYNEK